jgi:hypothetical protein
MSTGQEQTLTAFVHSPVVIFSSNLWNTDISSVPVDSSNSLAAPMGMRLRLKSSFDISPFAASVQAIPRRVKKVRYDHGR